MKLEKTYSYKRTFPSQPETCLHFFFFHVATQHEGSIKRTYMTQGESIKRVCVEFKPVMNVVLKLWPLRTGNNYRPRRRELLGIET